MTPREQLLAFVSKNGFQPALDALLAETRDQTRTELIGELWRLRERQYELMALRAVEDAIAIVRARMAKETAT